MRDMITIIFSTIFCFMSLAFCLYVALKIR
nr:MAG TPA: hypothetical protein [Caudoviricetes sp.]